MFNPPEEIIKSKKRFEYKILWMLNNREYCKWGEFIKGPFKISPSTLSHKMKTLIGNGYVEKFKPLESRINHYRITSSGKKRFKELEKKDPLEEKIPEIIKDLEHKILWMLYRKPHLKWNDLIAIGFIKSTLYSKLNSLLSKKLVTQHNKVYKITSKGRKEYFEMMQKYGIDEPTKQTQDIQRIQYVKEEVIEFFERNNVDDYNVRFRFLDIILKLDYSEIAEGTLSQEDFRKIILFISINHPDNFPEHISRGKFSKQYEISKDKLDFYLNQIVREKIFKTTTFFELKIYDKIYYLQIDENLGKRIKAIIIKNFKKRAFLNELYEDYKNFKSIKEKEILLNISEECLEVFNPDLRKSIKKDPHLFSFYKRFLNQFIKYLKFKYKGEVHELIFTYPDIKWEKLMKELSETSRSAEVEPEYEPPPDEYYEQVAQEFATEEKANEDFHHYFSEGKYEDALKEINKIIELGNMRAMDYYRKAAALLFMSKYDKALKVIEKVDLIDSKGRAMNLNCATLKVRLLCDKEEYQEALKTLEIFDEYTYSNRDDIKSTHYKLKAEILCELKDYDKALNAIRKDIEVIIPFLAEDPKYENTLSHSYEIKAFILNSIDKREKALKSINTAINLTPENLNYYRIKTEILIELNRIDDALDEYNRLIDNDPENIYFLGLKMNLFSKLNKKEETDDTLQNLRQVLENKENLEKLSFKCDLCGTEFTINYKDEPNWPNVCRNNRCKATQSDFILTKI